MPNIIEIHDPGAPELALFARLTERQLRSRMEPEKGIFIAETAKVVALALDAGCVPLALLMERRYLEGNGKILAQRCGQIPIYTAEPEVLTQLTGYRLTRGVLCAMRRPLVRQAAQICADAHRVAVLEGIVDATNIGAIFRSAAALGIHAVLLTPTCCDPLCRRAVRVSMGTIFQVPWARIESQWPEQGMDMLRGLGFHTVALALQDTAVPIDAPELAQKPKLAILLGAEGDGLARETIACCDQTACIPMENQVDSLNVAAASAVAFWQLRFRE